MNCFEEQGPALVGKSILPQSFFHHYKNRKRRHAQNGEMKTLLQSLAPTASIFNSTKFHETTSITTYTAKVASTLTRWKYLTWNFENKENIKVQNQTRLSLAFNTQVGGEEFTIIPSQDFWEILLSLTTDADNQETKRSTQRCKINLHNLTNTKQLPWTITARLEWKSSLVVTWTTTVYNTANKGILKAAFYSQIKTVPISTKLQRC